MQGTILQILVLVTHGNAILSGMPVSEFYPLHVAFKFDEFVKFVDLDRSGDQWKERPFAENPNEWLAKLRSQKCTGLRVTRVPTDTKDISDRMSVAFVGGGGRWLIEAVCPGGSDLWEAKWEIGNKDHPEQKIWRVTYGRIAKNKKIVPAKPASIDGLSKDLGQTLQEALSFSRKHKLDGFANLFDAGVLALNSQIEPDLHGIAPKGQLPLAASKLIAAAQASWVFGGMGSWNDLGFGGDDQKQYEVISDNLFSQINASLVAAANLSFQPPQKTWRKFWH